ncbi:MAG: hypothetical protein DRO46_03990, partial [Candidatus Hecatellales archaeon]
MDEESKLNRVVEKILEARPDLTRSHVLELVKRKLEEAGNLLNPEGAACLVASELGVELWNRNISTELKVKDLAPGLRDVSLVGRVLAVHPVKAFRRPTGEEGKLRRLILGDSTGTVEVYLW